MKRAVVTLLLAAAATRCNAADLELAYSEEFLTNGYANWRSLELLGGLHLSERTQLGASVRELWRFGLNDVDLGASVSTPLGERLVFAGEASTSPTHQFMPWASADAQVQGSVGAGFVLLPGIRWSRYVTASASGTPIASRLGVEYYWAAFRASWTGFLTEMAGSWCASQRATLDFYYGERNRVGAGFNIGRELDTVAGGVLVVTDVVGANMAGVQDLDADWSLVWEVGTQRQGDYYTRTGARIGIRRRF
jgi:YaiO family outer membrane protein